MELFQFQWTQQLVGIMQGIISFTTSSSNWSSSTIRSESSGKQVVKEKNEPSDSLSTEQFSRTRNQDSQKNATKEAPSYVMH